MNISPGGRCVMLVDVLALVGFGRRSVGHSGQDAFVSVQLSFRSFLASSSPCCKLCFRRCSEVGSLSRLEKRKSKQTEAKPSDLLCPWLSWVVGESIEPGELTDRPMDDMFITFECSFETCSCRKKSVRPNPNRSIAYMSGQQFACQIVVHRCVVVHIIVGWGLGKKQ